MNWKKLPVLLSLLVIAATLILGWQAYSGYVKDDAYISLRYARNLASGLGLVFNPGERLEGYTNFLWILLATPAFWLGANPLAWMQFLGCASAAGAAIYLFLASRWLHREGEATVSDAIPSLLFASSTSVALWSVSGLEGCFMALCSAGAFFHLHRGRETGRRGDVLGAGIWLLLACLTRPEGHALVLLAGIPLSLDVLKTRTLDRGRLLGMGLLAVVIVPYHLFRYFYFRDWLPNTFYVKASAGPLVWEQGVEYVKECLAFNVNGVLLSLAIPALFLRKDRGPRLHALLVVLFFLLYLAKIGRDEMKHFRLFLPAFPLLCLLGGEGLRTLMRPLRKLGEGVPGAVAGMAALGMAFVGVDYSFAHNDEASYQAMSEKSFQAMGRYLEKAARPGDACIFQDMGGTPYAAPSVRFVDVIGILNHKVAHELARIHLNPFMREVKSREKGGKGEIREFDRIIREYLFEQDARWVAFTAYVSKGGRSRFSSKFKEVKENPVEAEKLLASRLRGNAYYHGLYEDPRFARNYRYDRTWIRHAGYYLVLFEKRKPGEEPSPPGPEQGGTGEEGEGSGEERGE